MTRMEFLGNTLSSPRWAGDNLDREHLVPGGAKVDAAQFNAEDAVVVTVDTGGAAIGATSIPVTALPGAIPSGAFVNFGTLAPVTVTVSDASIAAGDTSFGITALPGPIPAGARLNFATGTNAQLVETSAAHAAGATTFNVLPLDGTIANGATALFSGGTRQARLTAAGAAAATALTVDELQFALAAGDTATYAGAGSLGKHIPSGTPLGRTFTERDAGTAFGPGLDTDDEFYLLAFDIVDADFNNDAVLYRHNSVVKENFIPGWAAMSSPIKAKIRDLYTTQKGVA